MRKRKMAKRGNEYKTRFVMFVRRHYKKMYSFVFLMMRIMLTFSIVIAYFNVFSDAMILCIGLFWHVHNFAVVFTFVDVNVLMFCCVVHYKSYIFLY